MSEPIADLKVAVSVDDAAFAAGMKKTEDELKKAAKTVEDTEHNFQKLGGALTQVGGMAKGFGAAWSMGVSAPLLATAGYAVKLAGDLQQTGNVFQAVTHASSEQMDTFRQKATELGADMTLPGTSAVDAGRAMGRLGEQGLKVSESMDAAKGTLQLAAVAEMNAGQAAEVAGNALNAFHLEGSKATHVADMLSAAAFASGAKVNEMAFAFQAGAAVAHQANLSIEEYTTSLALLSREGIKGSDAGTSVKSMLMALIAPTERSRTMMEALGVSVYDGSGKMRGFTEIIGQFEQKLGRLTEQDRNLALGRIFGTDGIRAAEIIFNKGVAGFTEMEAKVNHEGAAAELAAAKNKGLIGALDGLRSAIDTLLEKGARPFLAGLEGMVRGAGDLIEKLSDVPEWVQSMAIGLGVAAIAVGPLVYVVGTLAGSIGNLITVSRLLFGAEGILSLAVSGGALAGLEGALAGFVAFLTGPVGLAILGVTAAIGGLVWAYQAAAKAAAPTNAELMESARASNTAATANLAHATELQKLVDEYANLQKVAHPTADEMERMKELSLKIAGQSPDLVSAWATETGQLNLKADALDRVNKALAEQRTQAHIENLRMTATKNADIVEQMDKKRDEIAQRNALVERLARGEKIQDVVGVEGGGWGTNTLQRPILHTKTLTEELDAVKKLKSEYSELDKKRVQNMPMGQDWTRLAWMQINDAENRAIAGVGASTSTSNVEKPFSPIGRRVSDVRDAERERERQIEEAHKAHLDFVGKTQGKHQREMLEALDTYNEQVRNKFIPEQESLALLQGSLKETYKGILDDRRSFHDKMAKLIAPAMKFVGEFWTTPQFVDQGAVKEQSAIAKASKWLSAASEGMDSGTGFEGEYEKFMKAADSEEAIGKRVLEQRKRLAAEMVSPLEGKRFDWIEQFSKDLEQLDPMQRVEELSFLNDEFDKMIATQDKLTNRGQFNRLLGDAQKEFRIKFARSDVDAFRAQYAEVRDIGAGGVQLVDTLTEAQAKALLGFKKMEDAAGMVHDTFSMVFGSILSGSRDMFAQIVKGFEQMVVKLLVEQAATAATHALMGFIGNAIGIGGAVSGGSSGGVITAATDGPNGLGTGRSVFLPYSLGGGGAATPSAGRAAVSGDSGGAFNFSGNLHVHVNGAGMTPAQAQQTGSQIGQAFLKSLNTTKGRLGG